MKRDPARRLSMDGLRISGASLLDLAGVVRLERACFENDAWSLPDVIGALIWPGELRLKAAIGKRLIGFAMAEPRWGEDVSMITTLGVDPEYRRRGIGAELLSASERLLPGRKIHLTVREDNQPAIELYKKFGYQYLSRLTNYYRDGRAGLLMEKTR